MCLTTCTRGLHQTGEYPTEVSVHGVIAEAWFPCNRLRLCAALVWFRSRDFGTMPVTTTGGNGWRATVCRLEFGSYCMQRATGCPRVTPTDTGALPRYPSYVQRMCCKLRLQELSRR